MNRGVSLVPQRFCHLNTHGGVWGRKGKQAAGATLYTASATSATWNSPHHLPTGEVPLAGAYARGTASALKRGGKYNFSTSKRRNLIVDTLVGLALL